MCKGNLKGSRRKKKGYCPCSARCVGRHMGSAALFRITQINRNQCLILEIRACVCYYPLPCQRERRRRRVDASEGPE